MLDRLLDTNIPSFWIKRDTRYRKYRLHLSGNALFLSFQSLGELLLWSRSLQWGADKQKRLDEYLATLTIIHSNERICRSWAFVQDVTSAQPMSDAWIAATAVAYNLELVTHNPADFVNIPGLTVISETP